MIGALVPPAVVTIATGAELLETPLFAEELRALGSPVDKRRREFVTGRACARRALAQLGLPATPVGSGERGEPLWPAGVVGSITHCAHYRACAVGRTRDVRAVGIDAEPNAPLDPDVLGAIASTGERRALRAHGRENGVCWDRLLFSAKEAIFKAWSPLTGRTLRFEDVAVRIDPRDGTFCAKLLVDRRVTGEADVPAELAGRWCVTGGIVATAIVVVA